MKLAVALGFASLASAACLAACTSATDGRYSQALSAPPAGECGDTETHVIGIYAAPQGESTVSIERKGKHVLVLSAYEKTTWHIKAAPGAEIVHVYATGFHDQIVDLGGVSGKQPDVHVDSGDKHSAYACGYTWPADGQECDTDALLELVAARTGHDVNSFAGCYAASSWKIGKDMAASSDCGAEPSRKQAHFFSCDAADTDGKCGGHEGSDGSGSDASGSDGDSGPIEF